MAEPHSGEHHFVFNGLVLREDDAHVSVQLFPGLTLDIRRADIEEIEEAQDEITQRNYVRVKLKQDADVNANFKPRLMRLAVAAHGGVPFAFGGAEPPDAVIPSIDPNGLPSFVRALPPETWAALAHTFGYARLNSQTPTSPATRSPLPQTNSWVSEPSAGDWGPDDPAPPGLRNDDTGSDTKGDLW